MAIDSIGGAASGADQVLQGLQLALQQGQAAAQVAQSSPEAKQVNASGSTQGETPGRGNNPDLGQNLDIEV